MKAVRIYQQGGIDVMKLDDVEKPFPGEGEVLVQVHYAGVNFIDTYHRSGLYSLPSLPFTLGQDGSGIVVAIGKNVKDIKIGDRVSYYTGVGNAYAEYLKISENACVKVPESVGLDVACACMVQGLTAHYLVTSSYAVKDGDVVLVHAAAGGTGQLLGQMARILGATVIGTVSTEAKAKFVKDIGAANHTLLYTNDTSSNSSVSEKVRMLTKGKGVQAVYDGVGKDTFQTSLDSLAVRGSFISFGNASGKIPNIDPYDLSKRGSLTFIRPKLSDYLLDRKELDWRAGDVFKWLHQGKLMVNIHKIFPSLSDAAKAHTEIEGRRTLGKILLRVAAKH